MTVGEALRSSGIEPREARLLLAHAAGLSEATVIAFDEQALPPEDASVFFQLAARRKAGEPIAYIVGHKEFYGIDLVVNPAVLIPRPETELLVELALQRHFSSLADLGTGSGAIALAIKHHRPAARVTAVESSMAALLVAKHNAMRRGQEIRFLHGRWLEPLAGERFDLVVCNPPYVADDDPHLAALHFEPPGALVGGADGLDCIREIASAAPACITSGGWLLLEHGMGQDAAVRALLEAAGLESVASWPDLAGIPRVSGGKVK